MKTRNFKKAFSAVAMSASLATLVPVTTVLAANVGGGNWTYGSKWNFGWSKYYHGTRTHSASVGLNSDIHTNKTSRGNTAYAEYHKIPASGLSYYWNVY